MLSTLLPMLSSEELRGQSLAYVLWGMFRLSMKLDAPCLSRTLQGAADAARSMNREQAVVAAWAASGLWINSRRPSASAVASGGGLVERRRRRLRARRIELQGGSISSVDLDPSDTLMMMQMATSRQPAGSSRRRSSLFGRHEVDVGLEPLAASLESPVQREEQGDTIPKTSWTPDRIRRSRGQRPTRGNAPSAAISRELVGALSRSLEALLLPSSELSADESGNFRTDTSPPAPRTLAMAAAAWARLGRHASPPPGWLRWALAAVRALSERTMHLRREAMQRRGGPADGPGSASSSGPVGWDAASLLVTVAALRRLRVGGRDKTAASLLWETAASASGGGCDAEWSLPLLRAAALHVNELHSQQLSGISLGLAALCSKPRGRGSPRSPEDRATQLRDDRQTAVDMFALLAVSRCRDLWSIRTDMLREMPKGRSKRHLKVVMPAALTPLHTARLAAALIVGLEASLPRAEAQWLKEQLERSIHHLPETGVSRSQAEAALRVLVVEGSESSSK